MGIGNTTRAITFWSWNNDISKDEIVSQFKEFSKANIGVVIHARAGLRCKYMGDTWFACLKAVLSEAEKTGTEVYLYDEDGWPSGSAGGKVPELKKEYCLKRLNHGKGIDTKNKNVIAAYRRDMNEWQRISISDINEDTLVFWYDIESTYTDLLNRSAVAEFIGLTHEKYFDEVGEYFGNVIKGIFTDEPALNGVGLCWNEDMPKWFQEEYDENLLNNLWRLTEQGDEHSSDFRLKWWNLIQKKYGENYVEQLSNWCQNHKIVLTGHFACEDGLTYQIPTCGGVMRHYKMMQLPAIDYLGDRICSPILMKQLSSVAHQFGKGNCMSETFGCSGWNISFERLLWIWGNQAVLGITKPCFHLSAYSLEGRRKRDYPPSFSYHSAAWENFSEFTTSINEMNYLSKEGNYQCSTLVISPLSETKRYYSVQSSSNPHVSLTSTALRSLLENMLAIQWDCELGDEELLSQYAIVENNSLCIGNAKYKTVVVPNTEFLNEKVWKLLYDFALSGGELIFIGALPYNKPDYWETNKWKVLQNRSAIFEKFLLCRGDNRPLRICESENGATISGIRVRNFEVAGGTRHLIWNDKWSSTQKCILKLPDIYNNAKIIYSTYEKRDIPIYNYDKSSIIPMEIKAGEVLIVDVLKDTNKPVLRNDLYKVEIPENIGISLCEKNCLTLDTAQYKLNDMWSNEIPVILMNDILYQNRTSFENQVQLKFCFENNIKDYSDDITLCLEDRYIKSILFNQNEINTKIGWWLDKGINEYNISKYIKNGKNEIILTYYWGDELTYRMPKSDFEGEKNRFFYPLEFESIYIRGIFDVNLKNYRRNYNSISVKKNEFSLIPNTLKAMGDLTVQGANFYRGNVQYSFNIDFNGEEKIELFVKRLGGALVRWHINGYTATLFPREDGSDITYALNKGENNVMVEIIGTNRNLLGPHHHILGELGFIGPYSFEGLYGFTDSFIPELKNDSVWTDEYSFVPFGIEKIQIHYYKNC